MLCFVSLYLIFMFLPSLEHSIGVLNIDHGTKPTKDIFIEVMKASRIKYDENFEVQETLEFCLKSQPHIKD